MGTERLTIFFKKIACTMFLLYILVCCSSDPYYKLQDIDATLREDCSDFSRNDWEDIAKEFYAVNQQISENSGEYTEEELSNITKMKQYCLDRLTKVLGKDYLAAKEEEQKTNKNEVVVQKDETVDYNDDPTITPKSTERRHTFWSVNGQDNVEMLREACDFTAPKTKGFANKLAGKAKKSDGTFNIEQICEIFDYCYSNWRYVNDPKGCEYLAMASESITNSLTGDCDDFAVLIASCMLAIGGEACVIVAQGPQGGHAYSEVDVSHMDISHVRNYIKKRFGKWRMPNITIRKANGRSWLNLDWQANYPGGPVFNATTRQRYYCINNQWYYESNAVNGFMCQLDGN